MTHEWSLIWGYFHLLFFMLCFHDFFFVVAIPCSWTMFSAWTVREEIWVWLRTFARVYVHRFKWHGRTELNRKDFKWFNTPASSALFFFLAANMVRIDHGLKKRSMGFLTKRHHYRALIFPLAWIAAPRHRLDILYFHPS